MTENALVTTNVNVVTQSPTKSLQSTSFLPPQFTYEQKELAKKQLITVASANKEDKRSQPTDDDAIICLATCLRYGLDPFTKQIYCMKRYSKEDNEYRLSFEIGIDGFRVIAQRNSQYDGQSAPQWCGADGKWKDIWIEPTPPAAARVFIYHKGISHPFVGLAFWKESSKGTKFWTMRPAGQLAKCAEASGFRKAFPQDFSGLYIPDEMPAVLPVNDGQTTCPKIVTSEEQPLLLPPQQKQLPSPANGIPIAHNPNEDEYEYRERGRLLGELFAYMKQKEIQPNTVKAVAQDLGITNDAYHMTSAEITKLYIEIKKSFDFLEKNQQEPVAPFTPPEESKPQVEDPTVVILNDQTIVAPPPQPELQPVESEKKNE